MGAQGIADIASLFALSTEAEVGSSLSLRVGSIFFLSLKRKGVGVCASTPPP
jgi:hypothetical protein